MQCDTSDSYFSITSPVTPPSLPFVSIFSPSSGEALTTGQSYRIKWTNSPNIDKVTIGYSFGEGSLNWFANNSANNIPNNGYYDWNVNIGNTTNSKVRLCITGYQTGVGSVSSCSDYFTVNSLVAVPWVVTTPTTFLIAPPPAVSTSTLIIKPITNPSIISPILNVGQISTSTTAYPSSGPLPSAVEMWGPWVAAKQSADVYVGDMAQFTSTRGDTSFSYSCGTDGSLVINPLNPNGITLGTFYCTYTSAGSKVVSISQNNHPLVSKKIQVIPATVTIRAQQLSSLASALQAIKDALKSLQASL